MIFMGRTVVGNVEAAAFKYHRRRMEDSPGFTLTSRTDGLWLIVKALLLIKTVAAGATFIFIDRHGKNHLAITMSYYIL